MKRLDIRDSGTLGFHIKKMNRLFKKNELEEYILNDLGLKAYQLIKEFEGRKPIQNGEMEYEDIIISDKLSFEYTEELARKLFEEGKRVIFTDIISLIIHEMPKDLFEKTVREISDCIYVKVPRDLYESTILKTDDVLNISIYEKDAEIPGKRFKIPGISLITEILSSVMKSIPTLISSSKFTSKYKELYLENEIAFPERFDLDISLNGGVLELIPGEGYLKVWKSGLRDPIIEYKINNNRVEFELGEGYLEIYLPSKNLEGINIGLEGGVIKIRDIKPEELNLDLNGGYAETDMSIDKPIKMRHKLNGGVLKYNLNLRYEKGESEISSNLNGGICRGKLTLFKDIKIKVYREVFGGYAYVEIDDSKILNEEYVDEGFEKSDRKLKTNVKIFGGILNLKIIKSGI